MMTTQQPVKLSKEERVREKERRYKEKRRKKRTTQAGTFRQTQEAVRKQIPSFPEPRVLSLSLSLSYFPSFLLFSPYRSEEVVECQGRKVDGQGGSKGGFVHLDRRDEEVFTMGPPDRGPPHAQPSCPCLCFLGPHAHTQDTTHKTPVASPEPRRCQLRGKNDTAVS